MSSVSWGELGGYGRSAVRIALLLGGLSHTYHCQSTPLKCMTTSTEQETACRRMFLISQPVRRRVGALQKGWGGEMGHFLILFSLSLSPPPQFRTALSMLYTVAIWVPISGACEHHCGPRHCSAWVRTVESTQEVPMIGTRLIRVFISAATQICHRISACVLGRGLVRGTHDETGTGRIPDGRLTLSLLITRSHKEVIS